MLVVPELEKEVELLWELRDMRKVIDPLILYVVSMREMVLWLGSTAANDLHNLFWFAETYFDEEWAWFSWRQNSSLELVPKVSVL